MHEIHSDKSEVCSERNKNIHSEQIIWKKCEEIIRNLFDAAAVFARSCVDFDLVANFTK